MRKYTLFAIFLATLLNVSMSFADEENVYLSNAEVKKSEYKYIDGKIYYTPEKIETNIKNEIKVDSNLNEKINYNALKRETPSRSVNNDTPKPTATPKTLNKDLKSPNEVFFIKGGQPCFEEAARYHNVDPWLLMSIAYVESRFNPKAVNRNKNGSYDTGMMQINSIWHSTLKKKGIDKSLLTDACASTYIGAWILSSNIKRYGYNWRAIGAYNSGNPKLGLAYAKKVYAAHAKITGIKNKASK